MAMVDNAMMLNQRSTLIGSDDDTGRRLDNTNATAIAVMNGTMKMATRSARAATG